MPQAQQPTRQVAASAPVERGSFWNSVVLKLTVLVGALLVVTSGGLSWLFYSKARDVISNQVEERLQVVAGARQAALLRFITQQQTRISMMGRSTRIRDLLSRQQLGGIAAERLLEDTNNLLKDAQESTPGFLSISLTDRHGRVIRSTDEELLGRDLSTDPDMQLGLREPHLGLPFRQEDRFVAWLAAPAEGLNAKKHDQGAILVQLDMSQAQSLLDEREGLEKTGRVFLATRVGERLRFLLDRDVDETPQSNNLAMSKAIDKQSGFMVTTDHRSHNVLAAYRPLGNKPIGLVAQMDTDEAYAQLTRLRRTMATVVFGVLFVGLGGSYVLARRFAEPILNLARAAQYVAAGRWETRVAIAAHDEIGQLAASFNRMTEELAASYALLEDRVAARTAALARSEQDNRDQRQILESILNSMGDGVAVCSNEGHFLIFNPAGRQMLGLGRVEAPISEWPKLYGIYLPDRTTPCPPESLPLTRALRGESTDSIELYINRDDLDDGVWLSVTGRPMRDESGNIRGGVVVFRNTTLQKRAEEALRQSQARYMSLVESLPLAVWSKDLDGVFTFGNQLLSDLIGHPTEQIVGKTDFDLFPRDLAERYEVDDRVVIEQHRVLEKVETLGRQNGEEIFVQTFKAPLFDEHGRVVGTQGLCWDISPLKRTEAALRTAREEADAANRAKSAFLANISHEIRTPMNGIVGITELVLDTPLSTEQRAYLGMVRESADTLLAVINDLLDFSKIDAGRMDLDATEFDLADEIGDCMKSLGVRAHKKGLELTYRIAPDVPTLLIGDPVRLRQVLVNLTGNAIKFTHEGEVVVDVRGETTDVDGQPETALRFIVRDTGIGIPKHKIERIFGAFEQADVSTTRKYGGTGLGLSISARLIELMGGHIAVQSREGEGSTFEFTARFELQSPSSPAPSEHLRVVQGLRVLLVDDHLSQRNVLGELLNRWAKQVVTVDSTQSAREQLATADGSKAFDVVVVDAGMNDGDGIELAKQTSRAKQAAVVLLVTADCSMSDTHNCREEGVTQHLIKPVKPLELLEGLAAAINPDLADDSPPVDAEERSRASRTLNILLVEDSDVNRTVATRLLEKRGHRVTVLGNGLEAVETLGLPHDFDVVLMDVQMPVMDGLAATFEIRRQEDETNRHVPIIAMTAHAMQGDRERCLEAGMDGYVAKPVRPNDLFDAVERLATPPLHVDPEGQEDSNSVVDWDAALDRLNGDRQLLCEMVSVFKDEAPRLMLRIVEAIQAEDAPSLQIAAHTLKGAVGNFAAKPAFEAALRLETLAKDGNFTEVLGAQAAVELELDRLLPALTELEA